MSHPNPFTQSHLSSEFEKRAASLGDYWNALNQTAKEQPWNPLGWGVQTFDAANKLYRGSLRRLGGWAAGTGRGNKPALHPTPYNTPLPPRKPSTTTPDEGRINPTLDYRPSAVKPTQPPPATSGAAGPSGVDVSAGNLRELFNPGGYKFDPRLLGPGISQPPVIPSKGPRLPAPQTKIDPTQLPAGKSLGLV